MAEAQLGLGDGEAARATVEQAIQSAQARWHACLGSPRTSRASADPARLDGAAARAAIEACLGRAETLVAETGARAQTPFVIEERARLAMVLGDTSGGARLLQEARRAFDATGAAGHAARLASELAVDRDG